MSLSPKASERAGRTHSRLTLPNAICLLRIAASPALVIAAARGERRLLIGLFVGLALSDWLDGKLAIWLDQRSDIGPRLDSLADLAMYAALLAATLWVDGVRLLGEWPWLLAALASWATMGAFGLLKFGRWPALHTRGAKISWLLIGAGVVAFLGQWSVWPLRIALISVALANLHALAILRVLPVLRQDVPSLKAARAIRR